MARTQGLAKNLTRGFDWATSISQRKWWLSNEQKRRPPSAESILDGTDVARALHRLVLIMGAGQTAITRSRTIGLQVRARLACEALLGAHIARHWAAQSRLVMGNDTLEDVGCIDNDPAAAEMHDAAPLPIA